MATSSYSQYDNKIIPFDTKKGTESFTYKDSAFTKPIEDYIQSDETDALPEDVKTYIEKYTKGRDENMGDDYNDKYIDQRFKNVEERLDHKVEILSSQINALSDKISDNTEWMKKMVSDNADWMKKLDDKRAEDIKRIEVDGKETRSEILNDGKITRSSIRTTVIGSLFALFIGLACILFAINQMQNSWLQKYLDITRMQPSINQPINPQANTQNQTPANPTPTNAKQPQTSKP